MPEYSPLGQGAAGPTGGQGATGPVAVWNSVTKTTSYPITSADFIILANGTINLTLPVPAAKAIYFIKNISATLTATILPHATETIDGAASVALPPLVAAVVFCDGTNWWVLAQVATTLL